MAEFIAPDIRHGSGPVGRAIETACNWFAVGAGLVLSAMACMSVVSILGRSFFNQAIVGDYELVQAMCAVAISMSLPYAQWVRGHVRVDFCTARAHPKLNAWLDLLASLALALVASIIAWRSGLGLWGLKNSEEASMLLEIPFWWSYVPLVSAFALLAVAALYTARDDARRMMA